MLPNSRDPPTNSKAQNDNEVSTLALTPRTRATAMLNPVFITLSFTQK